MHRLILICGVGLTLLGFLAAHFGLWLIFRYAALCGWIH